jgi:YD repeat-containing protein
MLKLGDYQKIWTFLRDTIYTIEASDYSYGHDTQYTYEYNRTEEIELVPGSYTAELTHRSRWSDFPDVGHIGTCTISFTEKATSMAANLSLLKTEMYYRYDNYGNLRESKPVGSNISTVYIWGYKHQYPIAEVINATYEQVRTALNYNNDSQIEALAEKNEPSASDWTTINELRTKLPMAQVITYTYKPLVGILTAKDPRGVVTTYEYDAFGRLIKRSHDSKVVEEYNYNYKQ